MSEGYKNGGLKTKYKIRKTSGKPLDKKAKYFVLRYDKDPHALKAWKECAEMWQKRNVALTAEVERLNGQVEIGKVAQAGIASQLVEIQHVCIQHKKDKTNLRTALEKYGRHQFRCGTNNWKPPKTCTCGFKQALKERQG